MMSIRTAPRRKLANQEAVERRRAARESAAVRKQKRRADRLDRAADRLQRDHQPVNGGTLYQDKRYWTARASGWDVADKRWRRPEPPPGPLYDTADCPLTEAGTRKPASRTLLTPERSPVWRWWAPLTPEQWLAAYDAAHPGNGQDALDHASSLTPRLMAKLDAKSRESFNNWGRVRNSEIDESATCDGE